MVSTRAAFLLVAAAFLAPTVSLGAQERALEVRVEPATVPVGGVADLVVTARSSALAGTIGSLELPEIDGADVVGRSRSSEVRVDGAGVVRTKVFRYSLRARRAGTIAIPPVEVEIDGELRRSDPVRLAVVDTGFGPGPEPAESGMPALFAVTRVDRRRAVVGEQITLTFAFYQDPRLSLEASPDYDPPRTPGFWRVELDSTPRLSRERIGGREYRVQRFRYALFPLRAGRHTIGPAEVHAVESRPGRWWEAGRRRTLRSEPLHLVIDPLPAGAPRGFDGAVGRYRLSGGVADRRAREGMPVELEIVVRGRGNPSTLPPPALPSWDGVAVREPVIEARSRARGTSMTGVTTFRWQLVPRRSGAIDLGAARLVYYDPSADAYSVDSLRLGEIRVVPGSPALAGPPEKEAEAGPTLWPAREPRAPTPRGLASSPLYWGLLAGPWLAWLGAAALARSGRRRPGSGEKRRRALESVRAARSAIAAGEADALAKADAALRSTLAGLSPEEETARVVGSAGQAREAIAAARFGEGEDVEVESALAELERNLRRERASRGRWWPGGSAILLSLLALGALSAQEPDPRERWIAANRAYRAGDYAAAIAGYETLLDDTHDPRLTADLAAALWRAGREGEAVAGYLRARRLDPRASGVRDDLSELRSSLGEPPASPESPVPGLGAVRLDELLALLLAANALAFGAFLLARRQRGPRWAPYVAAGLVVAVAGLAALHAATVSGRTLGVAVSPAPVAASPGGDPIATVAEGGVVEILERAPAAWRIRARGEPAGWVASDRISPLD